eukprot:scaffold5565_cov92-Cylindrotheca_fusiformis.AAC.1
MERPNMDERSRMERSEIEEVGLRYFVYTSETKDAEVPRTTLTHLTVDSSVREIPMQAFRRCEALQHVHLPDTLIAIGRYAFAECWNLKCVQFISHSSRENPEDGSIVIPETEEILWIQEFAFSSCTSLRKLIVCSDTIDFEEGVFRGCNSLISVELPEGLQYIPSSLFEACVSLTTVKIPSSITEILSEAFSGCRSLTSFDLPHGLKFIGRGGFYQCSSIETLYIPATVCSIGWSAFQDCRKLKSIELPPNLETIQTCTFKGCHGLEYIYLPTTLRRLCSRAFENCSSLSHLRIPPSIFLIGNPSFYGCSSLISLEFPDSHILMDIDLSTCDSLVNIAGRYLGLTVHYPEEFKNRSKLGRFVRGYVDRFDDLFRRLRYRFAASPLNNLCYYQSYCSSEDAMVQLRRLMVEDPWAAEDEVDEFGMTPLHILSVSQTPNLDMLLTVMKEGHPDHIIFGRDSFGSAPMDYLCLNRTPNSTQVIRRVLQTRFDYWLGSEGSSKSNSMCQAVEDALTAEWSSRRTEIGKVYFRLAHYEQRMKILSLLDLCLWKMKIDEVGSEKEQITDRESCRSLNGASIVIPQVLPFLDKLDVEDYLISFPDQSVGSPARLQRRRSFVLPPPELSDDEEESFTWPTPDQSVNTSAGSSDDEEWSFTRTTRRQWQRHVPLADPSVDSYVGSSDDEEESFTQPSPDQSVDSYVGSSDDEEGSFTQPSPDQSVDSYVGSSDDEEESFTQPFPDQSVDSYVGSSDDEEGSFTQPSPDQSVDSYVGSSDDEEGSFTRPSPDQSVDSYAGSSDDEEGSFARPSPDQSVDSYSWYSDNE